MSMDLKELQDRPNHRASDVIVKEGERQVFVGRFKYGPLDWFTYPDQEVDIFVMQDGRWNLMGTEKIDDKGTVIHEIPPEKAFAFGMYEIKMTVKEDGSSLDFLLAVVHPKTEVVVFSIDGSFTAGISNTGLPPSVRKGSVDVVRFWKKKGYLIVYITGRPEMQLQAAKLWLHDYGFPEGMLSFADSYAPDPLGHKAYFLRNLIEKHEVVICAAYSNSKDIGIFSSINLKPEQIFILGEVSRKQSALVDALGEDYEKHLENLKSKEIYKPQTVAPELTNQNNNPSYNQ